MALPIRALVTGGAGFLGSHLCDRLLDAGKTVLCLDNFYTGSRSNLNHRSNDPRLTIIEHDVTEPFDIHVDEIWNLACPASPVHYQAEAIDTLKTSILGALNMLELARRCNARILQASTSEVYGDPTVHPQPESYWGHVNPVGPRACYDEGKRVAETLFYEYARKYGIRIKIVRIFNTYGPRMHPADGRVVSNFIMQALRGDPLTLYGDGRQTRSFCYGDDLVEAMIRMMATPDTTMGPINIGNPNEFTVLELAEKVLRLTGSRSPLAFSPLPADDPQIRCPDITKARETLSWEPQIALDLGLERTIAYFRSVIEAEQQGFHRG